MCVQAQSCPTLTPWTASCQAPLSMEFSRQEYWSGLLFPSPGHLPNPAIKPASPTLAGSFFAIEPRGKLMSVCVCVCVCESLCCTAEINTTCKSTILQLNKKRGGL